MELTAVETFTPGPITAKLVTDRGFIVNQQDVPSGIGTDAA